MSSRAGSGAGLLTWGINKELGREEDGDVRWKEVTKSGR